MRTISIDKLPATIKTNTSLKVSKNLYVATLKQLEWLGWKTVLGRRPTELVNHMMKYENFIYVVLRNRSLVFKSPTLCWSSPRLQTKFEGEEFDVYEVVNIIQNICSCSNPEVVETGFGSLKFNVCRRCRNEYKNV